MALAASTVFEIRQQATANAVNSGGFNPGNATPGTDYSQQLTSQYNGADLIAATATTTPVVTTTSSHVFTSADCGNLIHINSGANWSAGFYEIVSVTAGAATLDRACGTLSALTSGTYRVGGALSCQTSAEIIALSSLVPGNKVWVLGGATNNTYTLQSSFSSASGTNTSMIVFEGYAVTRGDRPQDSTRPIFATRQIGVAASTSFTSFIFTATQAATLVTTSARSHFYLCKFVQAAATSQACVSCQNYISFLNCEFISYFGTCISQSIFVGSVVGCYFHDSVTGIVNNVGTGGNSSSYINNIFDSMQTAGISYTGADDTIDMINGNTFFGGVTNRTGTAINMVTANANKYIINNIFYGLVAGINCTDVSGALQGTSMFSNWNTYFNNINDVVNILKGPQDVALDPNFANVAQLTGTTGVVSGSTLTVTSTANIVANQDSVYIVSGTGATAGIYSITGVAGNVLTLSSAPGGSGTNIVYQITTGRNFYPGQNLQIGAMPGVFPAGLTTGFKSIGAAQRLPTLSSTFSG